MPSLDNVLKIAAGQYLGDNAEDDGLPWMDHLERSQRPPAGLSEATSALGTALARKDDTSARAVEGEGDTGRSKLDSVLDAQSMHRDSPAPLVSDTSEDLESGSVPITHYLSPSMYSGDSSLQYWWDSRGRSDLSSGSVMNPGEGGIPLEASMPACVVREGGLAKALSGTRVAAKLDSIISMNTHPKRSEIIRRSQQLTPKLESSDEQLQKGVMYFTMRSPSSDSVRNVVLHFLRAPDGSFSDDLMDNHCLVGCDCPAFVFWGPLYYASSHGYLYRDMAAERILPSDAGGAQVPGARLDYYGESSPTAPVVRGQGCTFCKHIYAAYRAARALAYKVNVARLSQEADHVVPGLRTEEQRAEDVHADSYQEFVSFINSGNPGKNLLSSVKRTLEMHGASLEDMDSYITSKWNSLMAQRNYSIMTKLLASYKEAPNQLVYLLQRGLQLSNGKYTEVPAPVLRKAWDLVNGYFED